MEEDDKNKAACETFLGVISSTDADSDKNSEVAYETGTLLL